MSYKGPHCKQGDHSACHSIGCHCLCHLFDEGVKSVATAIRRIASQAWTRLRTTFPLVRHEVLEKLKKEHSEHLNRVYSSHANELREERKQLEELMPKLVKVTAHYQFHPSGGGRFVISAELNERLVYDVLRGMAPTGLEYFARNVAHEVERQIHTIDFGRVRAETAYPPAPISRWTSEAEFDPYGPSTR